MKYATVHKTREDNRVLDVNRRSHLWHGEAVMTALAASSVSDEVNTVFVERHNGTDRNPNASKVRKTYRFSKDWQVHATITYFTLYSYNFSWLVQTLRQGSRRKGDRQRTPAMAAA